MNDGIASLVGEKVESILYQVDYAHYDNFDDMLKYLELAEATLDTKSEAINDRMEIVEEEFTRTTTVLEMNNRKRQKEEELLRIQRERISKDLEGHQERLMSFSLSPITPILKQKKKEVEKLEQTKEIVEQFHKLLKGCEQDIKAMMPLDSKNFSTSALKIYVFKILLEDVQGREYENAKMEINKKYRDLKEKIIQNFKEGFRNKDNKVIRTILPYCEEYELMDEVSEYYNEQIFKSVHIVTQLNCQSNRELGGMEEVKEGVLEIKNMFFLIEQGFQRAFSYKDETTREVNPYQINSIMGPYCESFGRKLITYAFDKIISQSMESVLKSSISMGSASRKMSSTAAYLAYLEIFYDESRKLVKDTETIITDDRVIHLMSTYFESIFDTYLDSYITKELHNLNQMYEFCTQDIMKDISDAAVSGTTQYARDKEKAALGTQKKTLKSILNNFSIESRKNLPDIQNSGNESSTKIKSLLGVFQNPAIHQLFDTTKMSLARNNKIAKINEVDRNRNEILQVFISNMEEIIQNLISLVSEIVPAFDENSPPLDPQFFQIIPNINLLLQRIEIMYEEYKRENKYRLTEAIKLDQKKEALIQACGKSLNKVVGEAMASILECESFILSRGSNQYKPTGPSTPQEADNTSKVLQLVDRYLKVINKIGMHNYRDNMLRILGLQFVNELIRYYSRISYNKEGVGFIFLDIARINAIVKQFGSGEVKAKFELLQSLIEIYVIGKDNKSIEDHIRSQNLLARTEKEGIIQAYIKNKINNEK